MKAFIFFSLFFAVAFVSVLFNGGVCLSQTPVEFKLASQYPVGAPMHELLSEWAKKINVESKGRITIRIFPSGTLLQPPDLYDGVVKGVADMSAGWRYRPEGYEVGILIPTIMQAPSVEIATRIYEELWNQFPEIRNEWKDVKPLWLTGSVSVNIFTRKEFKKLDDLKGMQIRAPERPSATVLKDLGISPVFMSTADFPVALEKGTIDGGYGAITVVTDFKLEKSIKSVLMHHFAFTTPNWLIMNLNSYNRLTPDLKKVIDDSCDWGRKKQVELWARENERVFTHLKESGVNLVYFSTAERERFYTTVRQTHRRLVSELDGKGYPGTKILQFIEEKTRLYSR